MTQKDIIAEINMSLIERRAQWKPIGERPNFVNIEHEKRYHTLKAALSAFEAMTPAEFQTITTRAERQRQEAENQTTLF